MNGLATLLAPGGETPEVKGLAGRPPGSAETSTETDGFLGILQQMMVGSSLQMASAMSMLTLLTVQDSGGGGGNTTAGNATDGNAASGNPALVPNACAGSIIPFAAGPVTSERPEIPVQLPLSPTDSSPPGKEKAVLSDPAPPVDSARVKEDLVVQESMKEGPEAGKKPQSAAVANPVQAQAEVADADAPGPGVGKAVPAGTVIPVRQTAEPESHQGDTGKNPYHHAQMQFTPTKPSLIQGEPVASHVPDFLATLSAGNNAQCDRPGGEGSRPAGARRNRRNAHQAAARIAR